MCHGERVTASVLALCVCLPRALSVPRFAVLRVRAQTTCLKTQPGYYAGSLGQVRPPLFSVVFIAGLASMGVCLRGDTP